MDARPDLHPLGQDAITGWLDGLPWWGSPAAGGRKRVAEWTVDRRVNRTGEGDDDPTIVEPVEEAA